MKRPIDNLVMVALASLVVLLAGCDPAAEQRWKTPPPGGAPKTDNAGLESNVIRVNKFFSADPWLCFNNDGTGRIDGVRLTVYLEGTHGPKGVFGAGTIIVEMYRLDLDARRKESATLLHKWELPPDQAYPWRAKSPTGMGWGYGLRLHWPDTIDIGGRQVAFVVKYRREDGGLISSSRQVMRVPAATHSLPLGS